MDWSSKSVGYKKPPTTNQFKKGQSGNPRGRPRNRGPAVPYDTLLGQMVTIREDGRERRVTAAEAFLLHLTKRGLEGDSVAAGASLAAIEVARLSSQRREPLIGGIITHYVSPGSVGTALDSLGLAIKLNRYSQRSYYKLKPWIVQAAIAQFGDRRLTVAEQRTVVEATSSPQKVVWPKWWSVRSGTRVVE